MRLASGLLAAVLLTGCGGTAEPGAAEQAASTPSSQPRESSPSGPPGEPPAVTRDGLADKAEQQASALPPTPPAPSAPSIPSRTPVLGADVSWPQCPKGMGIPQRKTLGMPMPLPAARYVVIGLTNGPAYSRNPCIADQVRWVRGRRLMASAYAVASYPDRRQLAQHRDTGPYDGRTRLGALGNAGYQQALYNITTLRAAGLETPAVWVDVEPVTIWEWSDDKVANAAVVKGAARAYTDSGFRIGVYSTPHLWSRVVGGLRLGVPEWRAAGETSRAEALRRCGADWSIQGGNAVLGQWVERRRDQNVTCPGVRLDRWFHQY